MEHLKLNRNAAVITSLIAGILTHGYILYNKISFHDDIGQIFSFGGTYESGRWGIGIFRDIFNNTIGHYSSSSLLGLLTIICIACSAGIIVEILEVKDRNSALLIGIIMSVFPVVTTWFAYMFTAAAYAFSVLLAVGACLAAKKLKNPWGGVLASLLIAYSLGIYQAHLGISVCIFMCLINKEILDNKSTFKSVIKKSTYYIGIIFAGIIIYFLVMKTFLYIYDIELLEYQGINELGIINLFKGVGEAYKNFLFLNVRDICGITNSTIIRLTITVMIAVMYTSFFLLKKNIIGIGKKILAIILMAGMPIGINLIFVMTSNNGKTNVHTLMLYTTVLVFVLPFFFFGQVIDYIKNMYVMNLIKRILYITIIIASCYYVHLDNEAYLKATFLQEQTNSYLTTLVTQIKSLEGYNDDLSLVFMGMGEVEDSSLTQMDRFSNVQLTAYEWDLNMWINDYQLINYIKYYCGYSPVIISEDKFKNNKRISDMPVYPDSGSIRIIDNTIVVKMSKGMNSK